MNQSYTPVLMTAENGEPIAAIVDYEAFVILSALFDQLQALRNDGEVAQPAAWLQMCGEMVTGGYAEKGGAIE